MKTLLNIMYGTITVLSLAALAHIVVNILLPLFNILTH